MCIVDILRQEDVEGTVVLVLELQTDSLVNPRIVWDIHALHEASVPSSCNDQLERPLCEHVIEPGASKCVGGLRSPGLGRLPCQELPRLYCLGWCSPGRACSALRAVLAQKLIQGRHWRGPSRELAVWI